MIFFKTLFLQSRLVIFLFGLIGWENAIAQINNLPIVKTPTTPTAASFSIYGEIPVSKYTGIPDITIPLYTVEWNNMKIPINLSYHPGSVKVDSDASWVGLGWTLHAGGSITREIRGLDDFTSNGYWYRYHIQNDVYTRKPVPRKSDVGCYYFGDGDCKYYFRSIVIGEIWTGITTYYISKLALNLDCEPDLFTYNFLGYSGKFVLKEGENIAILDNPEHDLKIEVRRFDYRFYFLVTLPSGETFHFNNCDIVSGFYGVYDIADPNAEVDHPSIPAWYLTAINTPSGDHISFQFTEKHNIKRDISIVQQLQTTYSGSVVVPSWTPQVEKRMAASEMPPQLHGGCSLIPYFTPYSDTKIQVGSFSNVESYLSSIQWNGNRINFIHEARSDCGEPYDSKDSPVRLKAIEVRNPQNKLVKGISLGHSLVSNRLQLNTLTEYYPGGNLPSHHFFYDSRDQLPPKKSLSSDVWGYYNGTSPASLSENLFPEIIREGNIYQFNWEYPGKSGSVAVSGRNMRCNPQKITTGMLTKIIYPTGGYAEFTFEPHTYSSRNGGERIGGGVRIAKIKTNASEREFLYNDGSESSGLLHVYPVFGYQLQTPCYNFMVYTSRSTAQLQGNSTGYCVGYGKVTEIVREGDKVSSTIERFKNFGEITSGGLYTYDPYGYNGKIESIDLYDNGRLTQTTNYHYQTLDYSKRPNQRAMKYNDGIFYFYDVFSSYYSRLSYEEKLDYSNDGSTLSQMTSYRYGPNNFRINGIIKSGNNRNTSERILFSDDLDKEPYLSLKSNHIINKPIEVTQSIIENNVERVIGGQLIQYNERGEPEKVYKLETSSPLSDFVPFSATSGTDKDSRYATIPEMTIDYSASEWEERFFLNKYKNATLRPKSIYGATPQNESLQK